MKLITWICIGVAVTLSLGGGLAACDDHGTGSVGTFSNGANNVQVRSDEGGYDASSSSHTGGSSQLPGPACLGDCTCGDFDCCPTATECYVDGPGGVGDECLARRDNSVGATDRLQFKLTWSKSEKPDGNASDMVYSILENGAGLPWPDCNVVNGTLGFAGGFTQLLDIDLEGDFSEHRSRVGYAPHISPGELDGVLKDGLCMIEETYEDPDWDLGPEQMSSSDDYPEGLPPPMPRKTTPWHVAPAVAKRVREDFDISDDATREKYLKEIADDDSISGVFYLDDETGYSHGYSPLAWVVVYTGANVKLVVPIREAETFYQVNDPSERSCIGAYRADAMTIEGNCTSTDRNDPPWGCVEDCPGEAPGLVTGYFLITEIEQVYSSVLQSTLCITYPTVEKAAADGFSKSSCREAVKWEPSAPDDKGLPSGDWCAATNGPASPTCHDAFRNVVWQTYQGFSIRDETCGFDGP